MFEGAFSAAVVDRASDAFSAIIAAQRADGSAAGDHFGKPGANDRIWNAAQKLALHSPDVFADYYANDALAVVSQAWLGPRYQVTSQVNVVNPGGNEQVPHRDYHLGFVAPDDLAALSGAPAPHVAGADPAGRGRPLRHAGRERADHAAAVLAAVRRRLHRVQPARVRRLLRRAPRAGAAAQGRRGVLQSRRCITAPASNISTDIRRMANLLQISSPFGRAMEATGPHRDGAGGLSGAARDEGRGPPERELLNAVVATAEGYPVPHQPRPRSADRQPRPAIQVDTVLAALADDLSPEQLDVALRDQDERRIP